MERMMMEEIGGKQEVKINFQKQLEHHSHIQYNLQQKKKH